MFFEKTRLPSKEKALPGRAEEMAVPERHYVNGARLQPPFPEGLERALFGMGCFWGAEKKFWQLPGRLLHGGRLRRAASRRTPPIARSAAA